MILFRFKIALFVAVLMPACAAVDEGEPVSYGTRGQEVIAANGVSLNGVSLNGVSLNGVSLNGVSLNGVSLNGSELTGAATDGTTLSGDGFIGAELQGLLAGGGTTPVFIDDARNTAGIWLYRVSFIDGTGARVPFCGVDVSGVPVEAIGLEGRWDYREGVSGGGSHIDDPGAFTFACRNAALGKCVELGYKPWASVGGVSLKNHHQACTRMLRADYCGNGTSYTLDGTPINLYDDLGIQADAEDWPFEAEWGPAGARAVSKASHTRLKLTTKKVPACFKAKISNCAGDLDHFDTGTLLMSEFDKKIKH
jgi:ADYC domain/Pentapeptide repeats (8 copies)